MSELGTEAACLNILDHLLSQGSSFFLSVQKVSPDDNPKVQLQLLLHSNDSTKFHFVNPLGKEAQMRDREELKDALSSLLTKFQPKIDRELEEKHA